VTENDPGYATWATQTWDDVPREVIEAVEDGAGGPRTEGRVSRLLLWIAGNGACAGLFVYGEFWDAGWARRIVVFAVWLQLVLAWVYALGYSAMQLAYDAGRAVRTEAIQRPAVPTVVDAVYDVAMLLALVGAGWWATAIGYLLHVPAYYAGRNIASDLLSKHERAMRLALRERD
jgi:hypothetical protein